uniref:C2H2-type domain-containing protein n=1 Tax=Glossina austeni TaxID=7395 RepID=A0A1A9UZV9_GLOAU
MFDINGVSRESPTSPSSGFCTFLKFFCDLKKPYACQVPGCTKRYTDPSSLRKHVKNHTLRNANGQLIRRKSSSNVAKKTIDPNNATKTRRHSESSIVQGQTAMNTNINDLARKLKQNTYKPRSSSCSETTNFPSSAVLLNNTYENEQKLLNVLTDSQLTNINTNKAKALSSALPALSLPPSPAGVVSINRNSMNFNELSNCIVTIEHKQYQNCNESDNNNGCDNNRITIIDTNCRSNGNEHESINQLNEFQQQLLHVTVNNQTNVINNIKMTTTPANGQLTTASVESLNCKNKYTMSATNTTTNSISNKYRNNHFTTNTAAIATTTTANKVNSSTTTTTTTCAATTNTTSNTLSNLTNDNNNAHEFVSFEYVKKLLSETFDYMDEDGGDDDDNDDDNNILMKSMTTNDSVRSTSIATNATNADVINDIKQSRGMKTTLSINEISNISDKIISHDHVDQEFVNNFDMNYLPTFM